MSIQFRFVRLLVNYLGTINEFTGACDRRRLRQPLIQCRNEVYLWRDLCLQRISNQLRPGDSDGIQYLDAWRTRLKLLFRDLGVNDMGISKRVTAGVEIRQMNLAGADWVGIVSDETHTRVAIPHCLAIHINGDPDDIKQQIEWTEHP